MSLQLVLKIFTGLVCLWLAACTSSAAESVPFPKESMTTSSIRDDRSFTDSYVLAFINYTYRKPDGSEQEFSAEKARYGEGRILNVQGYLVHVTKENNISDNTACTEDIRGSRGNSLPSRPHSWIALIRRGACTFDQKIKHVFLHGAAGAIIYNEESTNSLEKMKILDKDRNITAVFTFKWIGDEMAKIVDEGYPVWVSISEGTRGQRPLTNINKTSVLFVSISFIVLMVISLIWLIFYYIQRFRYLQSKDQQSRHLCSVAKRIIMKIPTKSGKIEDKESENDCCAICIENYKHTDCIRILPCRHEFHKNCVDPWLLEQRTCPMCKLDVLKYYGFVFRGSEESIVELDLDMEIDDSGIIQRRSNQLQEIHYENNRNNITLSTTLQSLNRGLYIYANRQRSVSLQPNDIIKDLILMDRSLSSNSQIFYQSSRNQMEPAIVQINNHNNNNNESHSSRFLSPDDIGGCIKKRKRSKSADGGYLKFSLKNKNLCIDKKFGECSYSNFNIEDYDDKILLTNETTNPNNSEPPQLLPADIQIQIDEADE